jgi:hypothetical protein
MEDEVVYDTFALDALLKRVEKEAYERGVLDGLDRAFGVEDEFGNGEQLVFDFNKG